MHSAQIWALAAVLQFLERQRRDPDHHGQGRRRGQAGGGQLYSRTQKHSCLVHVNRAYSWSAEAHVRVALANDT